MKQDITFMGFKATIEGSILSKKALLNIQVQALDLPDVVRISVTALTITFTIGISKVQRD